MSIQRFKPLHLNLCIALALCGSATASHAQTQPNIGDVLRQSSEVPKASSKNTAIPNFGSDKLDPPMKALPAGPKVVVKSFDFTGNRELGTDSLQALATDSIGKSLSLAELEQVAQRITRHYRSKGYFVARAYIPAQEIADGWIRIQIVEGYFGKFNLTNKSLANSEVIQSLLDDVKKYDIVSLDTLERAMLIVNDTPGAQVVSAEVSPGEKIGSSDFAVETRATDPYNGYVQLDNFGSVYTGATRLGVGVQFNSPSGRGDRLSLNALTTENSGIANGRAAYSALLAPNGLRGEISLAHTDYSLGDSYKSLDAKGTADVIDLTLTYPMRRIRAQTIETTLNIASKALEDKIASTNTVTPKKIDALTAGLNLRDEGYFLGAAGMTQASIAMTFGQLSIKDATALSNDAAGADTSGGFNKITGSLSRVSLLPADFTLLTSLRFQQSLNQKNLDSSERMSVSGSSGVMGYPSGELAGSNAALVRVELSRSLPSWNTDFSNSWFVFANWGQAEAARPVSATDRLRTISDVGIGWNANWKKASFRVQVAHRLEETAPTSEAFPVNKVLAQLTLAF
ncbi:ShlB/FhaC/HecB family hemolysin secretion/activation protein [Rhodoferax mekongensis]|uniref:ShlB/FhaC/HecB family hemolysin secretion/activation protein n=1 Tax=Rhodoferax mekongensis TaxID=3068341 RepID=UPI0028BE585E|nr:POTRA domain-containing protein [Rhodoferax sp. TBRC 17199]MDT7516582.1 POTRA domain-containing protein [Rhodoferax sp. TBRC 17199]